ncbi:sensor histidine kinase [Paenibacillus sacheonensis]|uniref:HAMP domain-containing protein n=1 Tax=Paenibacillus sacheonensis TaxID=742054 RepID=A0A7X4YMB3_9BACL|nr:sensor histidine kinase [Paenibacillus sacheonensis]MBM7563436.1 two-component system sensor histidine kinase YesM [Paenibacillus sacheonensis]NBC68009.1 HAMP domain-containing protein [Paenibacillus sacheonensis]
MKIRTKLILANLFIMLLLLSALTYVLMKRSSDIVFDNMVENADLSLSQVAANLDHTLGAYEEIANSLYLNSSLQEMLSQNYPDLRDAYDDYFSKFEPLDSAMKLTQNVSSLIIYTDNPSFVFANFHLIDGEIRASDWYQKVMSNPFGTYWTASYMNEFPEHQVFSLRKRLNKQNPNSPLVVSIEVNVSVLNDLIHEESKQKRFIFTMPNGVTLLDSSAQSPIDNLKRLPFQDRILGNAEGNFLYKDGKDSYQVLFKTLDSRNVVRGMKVITLIPVTEFMPKIKQLQSLALVLLAGAMFLSATLIFGFSLGLTRRFTELSTKMRRVHKDNFESFIEVKGKDEVAQLGQIFNVMVRRLGQLVSETYQAKIDRQEQELRTKEAELYALHAQIKPHFLFNILNTIRGKLLISGDRDNARIIGLLAKSFRMMLKNGGQEIPLMEEIEFIDRYLQLQSYRYVDKFDYAIDIPEDIKSIAIPRMSLQPLVENAIVHGIELNDGFSHLRVTGTRLADRIHLTVEDDGLGLSASRLAEIHRWLKEGTTLSRDTHIGLRNVHSRLKDMYGESYGLIVESTEGQGARVTMILPDETGARGDGDV